MNSITLLNESVGMFCAEKIRQISPEISGKIDDFNKTEEYALYQLSHQSKNLIKFGNGFTGSYLSDFLPKTEILKELREENHQHLITLIREVENLRNNLAHGNSSEKIENVKFQIGELLKEYQRIAQIPNDIDKEEKMRQLKKAEKTSVPKKEKVEPKGIDAPKEKIDDLFNSLNNR